MFLAQKAVSSLRGHFVDVNVGGKKEGLVANATVFHLAKSGKHDTLASPTRKAAALFTLVHRDSVIRLDWNLLCWRFHIHTRWSSVFDTFNRHRVKETAFFQQF